MKIDSEKLYSPL